MPLAGYPDRLGHHVAARGPPGRIGRTRGGDRATDEEPLTLGALERDPHPLLARLRERTPVAWAPAFGGWLVTSYAAAVAVMRDSRAFTVEDPRFSTARLVGPSMLSLDGSPHARHRAPFFSAFHRGGAAARLGAYAEREAARLVAAIRPDGAAELRDTVTGPLAVSVATLARAETHAALDALLALPRLRLDPARPAAPRGLIFRKPPALHVTWDPDRRLGTSTVGPARSL